MQLQMNLACRHELELRAENEFLETIFPETELMLRDTEALAALKFVSTRKKADTYRSVMDFLFCEVAGQPWIYRCRRYYEGGGLALRFILDNNEIGAWDKRLCGALVVAKRLLAQERRVSWVKFRFAVAEQAFVTGPELP